MDTTFYKNKLVLKDHLLKPTYEPSPETSDKKVFKNLQTLATKHKECLTNNELKYVSEYEWKSSNFYVQPKINKCTELKELISNSNSHYIKTNPPHTLKGRSIIAGPCSPTKHLSQLIDKIIAPLVPLQISYIKDDWDFIKKLPRTLDYDGELFTCDIVSLYTSIPHTLGLKALEYWINRENNKIPERFTKSFIIDAVAFILNNNFFLFDNQLYHELEGTGMGIDFAASYACLSVGYLEEVYLFPLYLPRYFTQKECKIIQESYDRYMDDGFLIWPKELNINIFIGIINMLHPSIKYTVDRGKITGNKQELNMLDIKIILHNSRTIETDIFYKETNTHDYLHYDSHHPMHIKQNIPYNLAKRIIVFTSDSTKEDIRLTELKSWLTECKYPISVINKAFHNAKLQGPAPDPKKKCKVVPLISTYCSNYSNKDIVTQANILLENCDDEKTRNSFKNKRVVLAHKQPPNLLRRLSNARFINPNNKINKNGIFKCNNKLCKICKLYIQECSSFFTANNFEWQIKSHITCNSRNVLYYLKCKICHGKCTYTGKTNFMRKRTNNHISCYRLGRGTNIFDKHVYACKAGKNVTEPYFELYAFMVVKEENSLRTYEKFLHNKGYDTMNKPT